MMFDQEPNPYKHQARMVKEEMNFNRQQEAVAQGKTGDEMYLMQQEKKEDLTRWQQDIEEEIQLTIHDLKREMETNGRWIPQTEFTGEYEEKDGKKLPIYQEMIPMMNDLGINAFKSALRPVTSRNLMMSNYNEQRILIKLKSIVHTFIVHIAYNYERYGVDKGDLSLIVRLFKDIAEPAHWRCYNNGERNYLNTINKRVEAHSTGQAAPPPKPKGFLGGLLGA